MDKLILLFLFTLVSCNLPDQIDPDAYNLDESVVPDDAPAKWQPSRFPLPIRIDSSFNEEEKVLIKDMLINWETAVSNQIDFFSKNVNPTPNIKSQNINDYKDQTIGIYRSDKWFPASQINGYYVLAVTQFFGSYNGSYTSISHADVIVNFRDFNFNTDQTITYDLPSIVLHELGHLLGLDHNFDDEETIMSPSIGLGEVLRNPFVADEENMLKNYSINQNSFEINNSKRQKINIPVRIIHELNSDGFCYHSINGKLKTAHPFKRY